MAKQEIREFGDFTGENNQGYIIVGGKTADIEGGKKLLSDVIPSVPQADEETITNDNGELKVTNPIPDFTNHHDSILCVDEYNNNNLIWSDDRSDSFKAYDVYGAIVTSRKYNDEDNHDYPLYLNSSGGLSMQSSENEGDVLTTTEKGIEWKQPPAQVQADWAQNDNTQKDYIKNKPDIPTVPDIETTGDGSGAIRLSKGSITLNIDRNSLTDSNDTLAVKVPVPDPTGHNNEVLSYKNSEGIVWSSPLNSLYDLGKISIEPQLNNLDSSFGTGQDKPLLVPVIEATEIDEDDTSEHHVTKIAMKSESVFDLVNKNLQVTWPAPTQLDFPAQPQIGDTIEYKLVAEITGFDPISVGGGPQISLYWTKAQ